MPFRKRPSTLDWKRATTLEEMRAHLVPWEVTFVEAKIAGKSDKEAYREAGRNPETQRGANRKCEKYLTMIHEAAAEKAKEASEADVLSAIERRKYLARAVRTPISDLDPSSDLVQSVETRTSKDGAVSEKLTMVGKLDALELDAKLSGDLSNGGTPAIAPNVNLTMIIGGLPDTSGLPGTVVNVAPVTDEQPQETLPDGGFNPEDMV